MADGDDGRRDELARTELVVEARLMRGSASGAEQAAASTWREIPIRNSA
jgi:hypothetical protein